MPGRLMPSDKESLDYSLWEGLKSAPSTAGVSLDRDHLYWLWANEKGQQTHTSSHWKSAGRELSELDNKAVIDFIGLSQPLAGWFSYVSLNESGLIGQIQDEIDKDKNVSEFFPTADKSWLNLNWEVIGRIVGGAIAHIGKSEKWWGNSSTMAKKSHMFWIDVLETLNYKEGAKNSRELMRIALETWTKGNPIRISLSSTKILEEDWVELVSLWKQKKLDPSAEVIRAAGHRVSAPFLSEPTYSGAIAVAPNPLAIKHQLLLRYLHRENYSSDRFQDIYGQLTLSAFSYYIDLLSKGDYVGFVMGIHGMCANLVDRSDALEMNTGMRLFSNLGIKRALRGLEMVNVPDLANALKAKFPLSKALPLLAENNLIRWVTIDRSEVVSACGTLGITL